MWPAVSRAGSQRARPGLRERLEVLRLSRRETASLRGRRTDDEGPVALRAGARWKCHGHLLVADLHAGVGRVCDAADDWLSLPQHMADLPFVAEGSEVRASGPCSGNQPELERRAPRANLECPQPDRMAVDLINPRRLADDCLADFVFEHDAVAVRVKTSEASGRVDPARSIGRHELNFAIDSRRVEQPKARGIKLEEAAGPTGAQIQVGGVEAGRGFAVIPDSDGQCPRDGAVRYLERGREKLADLRAAPAIVDPILLLLCFRFAGGDCGCSCRTGSGRASCS